MRWTKIQRVSDVYTSRSERQSGGGQCGPRCIHGFTPKDAKAEPRPPEIKKRLQTTRVRGEEALDFIGCRSRFEPRCLFSDAPHLLLRLVNDITRPTVSWQPPCEFWPRCVRVCVNACVMRGRCDRAAKAGSTLATLM